VRENQWQNHKCRAALSLAALLSQQLAPMQADDFTRNIEFHVQHRLGAKHPPQTSRAGLSTSVMHSQDGPRASVGPVTYFPHAQFDSTTDSVLRGADEHTVKRSTQSATVGKNRPGSWSAGHEAGLHSVCRVMEIGGTRACQLDKVDLSQLERQFPEAYALYVKDGPHPLRHDVGLLDYAASDLARGLGFGLAVDLHLESLGMRAESRYRRF
jgi:hypothetical protein